ncbi:MAG: RND transporter, partial [Burkholderiales bacterium PBB5]
MSTPIPAAAARPSRAHARAGALGPLVGPLSAPRFAPRFAPLVGALSSALLTACASLAPPHTAPALPVPATWAAADAAAPARSPPAPPDIGWQDYFIDPALQALIAQALAHNRDLRQAALRVDQARAAYGIQRADSQPLLAAQADVTRARTPADLNLSRRPLEGNAWQVGLGLASWELDVWGHLRSLQDAALATYLASDDARRAVSLGLVAQVAQGYLALCELDERLALARQTLASRAESLRITGRRVDVGASSRLQLTQVRTLLTQAQALVLQLDQARDQQAHALALLVGASVDAPVDLPPRPQALGSAALARPLPAGLSAELLRQRPDVAAAERQLQASNALIGAARAAFYPRITLTGALGTASAELDGLFAGGSRAWTFTPSVQLPLWDGDRRRNNLALAGFKRDEALARYEQVVQAAFRDVADALSARASLGQQLRVAQDALDAQTERARLSQLRFDQGAAAYLD